MDEVQPKKSKKFYYILGIAVIICVFVIIFATPTIIKQEDNQFCIKVTPYYILNCSYNGAYVDVTATQESYDAASNKNNCTIKSLNQDLAIQFCKDINGTKYYIYTH